MKLDFWLLAFGLSSILEFHFVKIEVLVHILYVSLFIVPIISEDVVEIEDKDLFSGTHDDMS